jgi:ribosomal protein L11 methyltransferase
VSWLSIEFEVDAAQADAISESLLEAGADSVALEDADAGSEREAPQYAEPGWCAPRAWRRTRVAASVQAGIDPAALLARAADSSGTGFPSPLRVVQLEDEDWVRRTEAQFAPLRLGDRLWIVPSWCANPQPEAISVRLDPGLAFGTGSHPSTRIVLRWLTRVVRGGERVLDYGCGSGILAIAAAKLGVSEIAGVDLDPQALETASANARANRVPFQLATPEALPAGDYDLVLANILARPLMALEPSLARRTRSGGRIALSGVLETQAGEVIETYRRHFEAAIDAVEDGWVLIEGRRREDRNCR